MSKERIIVRREDDHYLVGYPQDPANLRCIACQTVEFVSDDYSMIGPYGEADVGYFLKQKIVHKGEEAEKVKQILEGYHKVKFEVGEKITMKRKVVWHE